ncbi:hypothetical protein [Flavobacterium branchiicola]|uniref:Uncharacterized protein n=1 Tax=Flavobacterium branchiicola TaxID=1114875 RepID=A0ABV9PCG1_9FLAO|nr:hypothetical protein [Flavobacterium branchiicola]MBS7253289.1 hypothetical protein [Flavobacterium branchiicola]
MEAHTLVLSTAKLILPEVATVDFVAGLISRGLTQVEYFGVEIDNHCDIVSDDMEAVSREICYIDIHFDSEQGIAYDSLSETEVERMALDLLQECRAEIRTDSKDITIYL